MMRIGRKEADQLRHFTIRTNTFINLVKYMFILIARFIYTKMMMRIGGKEADQLRNLNMAAASCKRGLEVEL